MLLVIYSLGGVHTHTHTHTHTRIHSRSESDFKKTRRTSATGWRAPGLKTIPYYPPEIEHLIISIDILERCYSARDRHPPDHLRF